MKKISSSATVFYKLIFPITWTLGVLSFFIVAVVHACTASKFTEDEVFFLIIPPLMLPLGLSIFYATVFRLADVVYYDENTILFKKWGKEVLVHSYEIEKIRLPFLFKPRTIEIELKRNTEFGRKLYFLPVGVDYFTTPPEVKDFLEIFGK